MEVHALGWIVLIGIIIVMITVDIVGHVRTPHAPTMKEAAWWSVAYVAMALIFGVVIWLVYGDQYGGEYFAGYVTEKSLSVDNLFVWVIIIAAFRIPRKYQQEVLLAGIIMALVLRFIFIMLGAAAIENFSWVFYIFGAFLIYTAIAQARQGVEKPEDHEEYEENGFVRMVRRVVPVTDGFIGGKLLHRHGGKTYITPMFLAILAVGSADVLFAVDSIPAIFGLTQEPYLVFAANAFSLLGLRQLYFLIDGLLDKLVYLHYGLALILGFIGVKLVIHALEVNELAFLNGGEPIEGLPHISTSFSLLWILGVLLITVVASVLKNRKDTAALVVDAGAPAAGAPAAGSGSAGEVAPPAGRAEGEPSGEHDGRGSQERSRD